MLGRCHLKEKRHNGFHFFHQNFLGNERRVFRGRDSSVFIVLLCCCKVTQSMRLGTYWTFGHFFLSPFAFQMALPNPNLPHCTLNRCTTVWGAEEGGPAGRTRNAVPGSGAGRSEDLRWWLRNSHKTMFRAGRWCQQTAAALQCPCRDEVEGCYDLSYFIPGKAGWLVHAGAACVSDKFKWCRLDSNAHINVSFHLEHKCSFH